MLFSTTALHLLGWPQVDLLKYFLNKEHKIYRMGNGGIMSQGQGELLPECGERSSVVTEGMESPMKDIAPPGLIILCVTEKAMP